jgi:hypothetical protein
MPDKPAALVTRRRLRVKPRIPHLHLFIPFPRPMIARGGILLRKRKF